MQSARFLSTRSPAFARRALAPVLRLALIAVLAGCAGHGHPAQAPAAPAEEPLFEDLGSYHHEITTRSPVAQQYFDQGLRLVYAFNHDEARRSFEAATRADPGCAMCFWGIALTQGTNYNLPGDDERDQIGLQAVQQAQALASGASKTEQDLIAALLERYKGTPQVPRAKRDRAYAAAMRKVARRHPEDLDAATLFAEAMMNLRPWDLWTRDGKPQPGTLEIVTTLQSVLKRDPQHPGANHYYIHALEASRHPERALKSAERLPSIEPGAGHLVHMPAHIYMRLGRYADAAAANEKAIAVDKAYLDRFHPEGVYAMMYAPHNVHFLWAAASMEGRSATALEAAQQLSQWFTPEMLDHMPGIEPFVPTLTYAQVRFGRWDEILAAPEPPEKLDYTRGMWHFARGLAYTRKGQLEDADHELAAVKTAIAGVPASLQSMDQNALPPRLELASDLLAGEIEAARGRTASAVRHLRAAAAVEDRLNYDEPPPWLLPARQYLGAVLLAAHRPREAELAYRQDLARHPENGWSLFGLAQSLRMQKRAREASAVEARFRRAWANADVELTASRF
jgi:tetratricopeptide (TPR) repeat protein